MMLFAITQPANRSSYRLWETRQALLLMKGLRWMLCLCSVIFCILYYMNTPTREIWGTPWGIAKMVCYGIVFVVTLVAPHWIIKRQSARKGSETFDYTVEFYDAYFIERLPWLSRRVYYSSITFCRRTKDGILLQYSIKDDLRPFTVNGFFDHFYLPLPKGLLSDEQLDQVLTHVEKERGKGHV